MSNMYTGSHDGALEKIPPWDPSKQSFHEYYTDCAENYSQAAIRFLVDCFITKNTINAGLKPKPGVSRSSFIQRIAWKWLLQYEPDKEVIYRVCGVDTADIDEIGDDWTPNELVWAAIPANVLLAPSWHNLMPEREEQLLRSMFKELTMKNPWPELEEYYNTKDVMSKDDASILTFEALKARNSFYGDLLVSDEEAIGGYQNRRRSRKSYWEEDDPSPFYQYDLEKERHTSYHRPYPSTAETQWPWQRNDIDLESDVEDEVLSEVEDHEELSEWSLRSPSADENRWPWLQYENYSESGSSVDGERSEWSLKGPSADEHRWPWLQHENDSESISPKDHEEPYEWSMHADESIWPWQQHERDFGSVPSDVKISDEVPYDIDPKWLYQHNKDKYSSKAAHLGFEDHDEARPTWQSDWRGSEWFCHHRRDNLVKPVNFEFEDHHEEQPEWTSHREENELPWQQNENHDLESVTPKDGNPHYNIIYRPGPAVGIKLADDDHITLYQRPGPGIGPKSFEE